MRAAALALLMSGVSAAALGADLAGAPLRGAYYEAPAAPQFSGFYVGGFGGGATADFKMSQASKQDVQDLLVGTSLLAQNPQDTILLPNRDSRSPVYGAFVGYNVTFDDVVMGVEADYSRASLKVNSGYSSLFYRTTSGPFNYSYQTDATATARIDDLATFRIRAGYVVGDFLPFITFGAALGHGEYGNTTAFTQAVCDASVVANCTPTNYTTYNAGKTKKDAYYGGYTFGAGVEANLISNLFLRAEYQWVRLQGGSDANINIARAGIGARF